MDFSEKIKTECLLNGVKVFYNACSTRLDLDSAKKYYHNYEYIGSEMFIS